MYIYRGAWLPSARAVRGRCLSVRCGRAHAENRPGSMAALRRRRGERQPLKLMRSKNDVGGLQPLAGRLFTAVSRPGCNRPQWGAADLRMDAGSVLPTAGCGPCERALHALLPAPPCGRRRRRTDHQKVPNTPKKQRKKKSFQSKSAEGGAAESRRPAKADGGKPSRPAGGWVIPPCSMAPAVENPVENLCITFAYPYWM